MPFNSLEFIFIFLPVLLFCHAILRASRWNVYDQAFLTIASVIFIGLNSLNAVVPLVVSLCLNSVVFHMLKTQKSPLLLASGILANLLPLISYKLLAITPQSILIPIGLSYYSFQQIGMLVNRFESEERTQSLSLKEYVFNILFFPKFLSGPIMTDPLQLASPGAVHHASNVSSGLFVFSVGLAKKVLIADTLLWPFISEGHSKLAFTDTVSAWGSILIFVFHMYFDFSGYSDMAYGIAKTLNYRVIWNFRSPFKSASIIEFWKNWHASLSAFVNFYFFNFIVRFLPARFGYQMFCILLSMIVIGVWHSFDFKYLAFGVFNGLALIVNYCFRRYSGINLSRVIAVPLTFFTFAVSFAFFSSPDVSFAFNVLKSAFSFNFPIGFKTDGMIQVLWAIGLFAFCQLFPSAEKLEKLFKPNAVFLLFCLFNLLIAILCLPKPEPFIYEGF